MKGKQYIIRNYLPGDEKEITSLFKTVFGKDMSIDQWRWKYFSAEEKLYTKVAQDAAGKIIAHAGAIRLRGVLEGRTIPFFQIVDVMVHPEYRGYMGRNNLFKFIMKALFEDISRDFDRVLCYGFPGKRPYILGEKTKIYDAIEEAIELIITPTRKRLSLFKVKPLDWKDRRINNLWETIAKDCKLSLVRDTKYLLWRYASNPSFTYSLLGLFTFGRLKGWVVIRQEGERILIVDLLVKKKRLREALKAIEDYFSKDKPSIHMWLPHGWRGFINSYKEQQTGVIVTNMIWQLPLKTPLVRDRLYYTMGDTDIF
jgi:hypothetical protein